MKNGFIVLDKPSGMTSHDVVNIVRRITGQKRAGHTGTLDPFATGVLPLALGEATKAIQFLDEGCKEYRAVMKLGETTDTQDCTGNAIGHGEWRDIKSNDLSRVFSLFSGRVSQLPPMFSALKHNGVPLYMLARRGDEVIREKRDIEVFSLVIERIDLPLVAFAVRCSRGTYVRTLAHDMGGELGCGAHLVSLQRTASGPFHLCGALSLERLASLAQVGGMEETVISPYDALSHLPDIKVSDRGREKVAHGIAPQQDDLSLQPEEICPGQQVRISYEKRLLAVAEVLQWTNRSLRLVRVFN
jgi:tRNA pseudouridine55 synthase